MSIYKIQIYMYPSIILVYLFEIIIFKIQQRGMGLISSSTQDNEQLRKIQDYFMENIMNNGEFGLFFGLLLLGIYVYNVIPWKEETPIDSKKEVNQSKVLSRYDQLKEKKRIKQDQDSYRNQLILELERDLQIQRQKQMQSILLKTKKETLAQSFIKNRGQKMKEIKKLNDSLIQLQANEKEKEKEKERKRKEKIEAELKEKQRKKKEKEEQRKLNEYKQREKQKALEKEKEKKTQEKKLVEVQEKKIDNTFGNKLFQQPLDNSNPKNVLTPKTKEGSDKPKESLFGKINPSAPSLFGGAAPNPSFFSQNITPVGDSVSIKTNPQQKKQPPKTQVSLTFGAILTQQAQKQSDIPVPLQPLFKPPQNQVRPPVSLPQSSQQSSKPAVSSAPRPAVPIQKLTPEAFLQTYIKFGEKTGDDVPIVSKMQDLLGARSLPSEVLTQAKTLINSIDKNDDKQLTSFANALYHTIIYQFINKSNIKSNLERIPPKSRTDQCEKNSINKYALTVNIYRMMGPCKKVWVIVFGKLLKLLEFLYKRKADIENYQKLELIQNGYIKKYKEIHSKYLCRIDFLIYMLFALTSYDPNMVFRQIQEKEQNKDNSRQQIESWGNQWSYAEFWALCQVIFANKHESYFKPIIYINLLYTLYPRIFENKRNPTLFKEENQLFIATLQKAKKYLEKFKNISEVKMLKESEDQNSQMNYEFDGDDFIKSIKVLDNRIPEKGTEFKLNAKDFEGRANVFYYFSKEK